MSYFCVVQNKCWKKNLYLYLNSESSLPCVRPVRIYNFAFILKSFLFCLPDLLVGWQAGCMAGKWSLMGTLPCSAILCHHMLYALLYSATPSICFTLLGHAFSPRINPHYYFTPAWTPVDMLCQSFVWYLLHSITELFLRLVHWCCSHYHNTVSDPFTFNLSTHTDTQFTPRLRPCLCFESLRWKNQFVVSSIYQVSPHHNGVDGVVNDDNPRPHSSSFPPTENHRSSYRG